MIKRVYSRGTENMREKVKKITCSHRQNNLEASLRPFFVAQFKKNLTTPYDSTRTHKVGGFVNGKSSINFCFCSFCFILLFPPH